MWKARLSSTSTALVAAGVLLVCSIVGVVHYRNSQLQSFAESDQELSEATRIGAPEIPHGSAPATRRERRVEEGGDSPLGALDPRLRAIVRDLETRAQFMDSPFGFTNEEQATAMDRCEGIVEDLTADDVRALIGFYRNPDARKLPLMGNELVGSMLYERWGKVAGGEAMDSIRSWIAESIEMIEGEVDLTDPFQVDPNYFEVGKVIAGWATVDRYSAKIGFNRLLDDFERMGLSKTDIETAILERFPELSQTALEN